MKQDFITIDNTTKALLGVMMEQTAFFGKYPSLGIQDLNNKQNLEIFDCMEKLASGFMNNSKFLQTPCQNYDLSEFRSFLLSCAIYPLFYYGEELEQIISWENELFYMRYACKIKECLKNRDAFNFYFIRDFFLSLMINTKPIYRIPDECFSNKTIFLLPENNNLIEGLELKWFEILVIPRNMAIKNKICSRIYTPLGVEENSEQYRGIMVISFCSKETGFYSIQLLEDIEDESNEFLSGTWGLEYLSFKQQNDLNLDNIINLSFNLINYMSLYHSKTKRNKFERVKGVKKSNSQKISCKWLGEKKDYYRYQKHNQKTSLGTPKRTHWRAGHWANIPIGPKNLPERDTKIVWRKPTLVNGDLSF